MMSLDLITSTGKRSQTGEIIVTLFEYCNLTCKFCNQDHDSLEGVKTISQKVETVKEVILRTPREQ